MIVGLELSHAPSRNFEIVVSLFPSSWDDDGRQSSFVSSWEGSATALVVAVLFVAPDKGVVLREAVWKLVAL